MSGSNTISIVNIVAWAVTIVLIILVLSIVVISLSPLDFTGQLKASVPTIVIVFILMILLVTVITITKYVPDIITRE